MSLIVEFYRASSTPCLDDNFKYGEDKCNLTCSEDRGPFSLLRQGAASDIYVIEAPTMLSFQAAILLSAGCCIHAVVWMLYMLEKIMREEERRKAEREAEEEMRRAEQERDLMRMMSHRASTIGIRDKAPGKTRVILVLFGAVGLALLVVGERNFHSDPLMYQIEPLSGVGQWSSIVTAVLAAAGSLLVPLHADMAKVREDRERANKENRPARKRSSRSYKVAVWFVDLEEWLDDRLKHIVGKTTKEAPDPEYPRAPGEEFRDQRVSGLHAAEQGFIRSRSPSIMTRPSHDERRDTDEIESPRSVHFSGRQDSGGFLTVPSR